MNKKHQEYSLNRILGVRIKTYMHYIHDIKRKRLKELCIEDIPPILFNLLQM